jgi:hypothetical protein
MKSNTMIWAGHVACTVVKRRAYKILVDMPEENKPLERSRCKLEVTVKEKGKIIHVTGRGRRGAHIFYTVD